MTVKFLSVIAATLIGLGVATSAMAECSNTKQPPTIPNGATASEDEMKAASAAVKGYMADTQDYLKCLEFEKSSNSPKYNSAQDQMAALAAEFNKQLRAFKSK